MNKNRYKKNKLWWISILLVAITAYGFGLLTSRYHIFPFQNIKHLYEVFAGKSINYFEKESFFKVNGSKADVVMIGDSITDGAEWNELFPNISIGDAPELAPAQAPQEPAS